MKREIKFRAWDKIRKQMFLNVEYGVDLGLWQPFGSVLEIHDDMIDFEVMQFTGLLDKNGKEIFESDIIKVYGQFEVPCDDKKDFEVINYEHIGTVVFNEGCFEFKNHLSKEKIIELQKVFEDAAIDTDIISSLSSFLGIEILGNVFENPELLKL